eukprot:gene16358-biopygen12051
MISEDEILDAYCDEEIEETVHFEERINIALLSIDEVKSEVEKPKLTRSTWEISINSLSSKNGSKIATRKVLAKLPKLELKKFSGKPEDWPEFWDGFKSAIDENEEVNAVDKFSYLRYYLHEPARKATSGLE